MRVGVVGVVAGRLKRGHSIICFQSSDRFKKKMNSTPESLCKIISMSLASSAEHQNKLSDFHPVIQRIIKHYCPAFEYLEYVKNYKLENDEVCVYPLDTFMMFFLKFGEYTGQRRSCIIFPEIFQCFWNVYDNYWDIIQDLFQKAVVAAEETNSSVQYNPHATSFFTQMGSTLSLRYANYYQYYDDDEIFFEFFPIIEVEFGETLKDMTYFVFKN